MQPYRKVLFAAYLVAILGALAAALYFLVLRQSYAWYMREFGIGNRTATSYLLSRQGFQSKEVCEAQLRSMNRSWPHYYCGRERLIDAQSEALDPFVRQ